MDELLPQLLAFPPHPPPAAPLPVEEYEKQIKSLTSLLNKTSASLLVEKVSGGGPLLEILDPSINTLPYLHVLLAHIHGSQGGKQAVSAPSKALVPNGELWRKTVTFLERFDPIQIRYSGTELRHLIEAVARAAQVDSTPVAAIGPVRCAILRIDPSGACFTSTHLLFVRLCLEANALAPGLPILDNDIFSFPTEYKGPPPVLCDPTIASCMYINNVSGISDKLTYQDHLQYLLYGAMVYMGLKVWDRALWLLEATITSPVQSAASMIQVEAYKKWVIVALLLAGRNLTVTAAAGGDIQETILTVSSLQPLPMPHNTNSQAAKHYRAIAKPYDALAEVFKKGSAARLRAEFEAGQQIWHEDCNTGLLLQVLDAYRRFSIVKLGEIYQALYVPEVAKRTSPSPNDVSETESYISSLIATGQLNATLTRPATAGGSSVLRFADSSSTAGTHLRTEAQMHADIVDQTRRVAKVSHFIQETDRRMGISKEYLSHAKKQKKNRDDFGTGAEDEELISTVIDDTAYGLDEDMMADF